MVLSGEVFSETTIYVIVLACLLDCILGDPNSRYHPVVLMGHMISFLERHLYRVTDSAGKKLFAGGLLVFFVLFVVYDITRGLMFLLHTLPYLHLSIVLEAFVLSFMITPKSLAQVGMEIYALLKDKHIPEARRAVGRVVGRDTEALDEENIARASIETVAENTVDGIISPLFFYVLGGLPLAVCYRAANTMDSMLGYKNVKYLYFGRIAARMDDVLNYIPARLTGVLFIVASMLLRLDFRRALSMLWRDASKHPSPNGGYAEAPVAGALGIRLGGENYYFGERHFRAYMGEHRKSITSEEIHLTVRLMYTATILFLLLVYVGYVCRGYLGVFQQ